MNQKQKHFSNNKYQKGYSNRYTGGQVVMSAVLIFLTLSLVVVIGISAPIAAQIRNSSLVLQSRKSVTAAETLNDDALYRLNTGRTLPATMVLSLNNSTSTAQITDVGGAKQIISIGESGATERISKSKFVQGSGVSINYGLQVGNGGLQMSGGPTIYGNVYSNGNITASGGSTITGSALAASANAPETFTYNIFYNADSYIHASTSATHSTTLGRANDVQLIAQSFTSPQASTLSNFSFLIKKNGAPANATFKVYNNAGGSPGTTQIGGTGSLSASQVTSNYDWVEVYPATPIPVSGNVTYWMTLEYQGSNVNYYTIGANDNVGAPGTAFKLKNKTGTTWGNWYTSTPTTMDALFWSFSGGLSTISGVTINGLANAGIVNNSNIGGNLYCQSGSGNNKSCDVSQPLPSPLAFPISNANIQAWKDEASSGTVRNSWSLSGSTATSTMGPMRINGDLTLSGGATLTLAGPLYVTGTINISGGAKLVLAASYGTGDEVMVSNRLSLTGGVAGGSIQGSGQANSYVMAVADGVDSGSTQVIEASGGTGSVVLVAPNGTIEFSGGATAKAAMAKGMTMSGGTTLVYESGLADISFVNGPSGAWNVESWKEVTE